MTQKMTIATSLLVACFLGCASLFGARGDKAEVKGMIISRTGDILAVKTPSGNVTVALTDETKTKDKKGLIGLRKQYMANTVPSSPMIA